MSSQTYMQRVRAERKIKLIKRFILAFIVLSFLSSLFVSFMLGRKSVSKAETTYNPDPCTLEVVTCENEPGYNNFK